MAITHPYTPAFYEFQTGGSLSSARAMVPRVMELIAPQAVIDLGCGTGDWLSVFGEHGVAKLRGIDGDYVDRARLRIPATCFMPADLARLRPGAGSYDLAVSLEVAEHLPAAAAEGFVQALTSLAPAVLFAAAVPFQDGTGHLNEQWPEYWAGLFAEQGYDTFDCLRDEFWTHRDVSPWYAQNMLLYIRHDAASRYPDLPAPVVDLTYPALARIHHRLWLERANPEKMGLRAACRAIPKMLRRRLTALLGGH
jgi:SAM-dependent methyltransferase